MIKIDEQKTSESIYPFAETFYLKGCLLFPIKALKNTFLGNKEEERELRDEVSRVPSLYLSQ